MAGCFFLLLLLSGEACLIPGKDVLLPQAKQPKLELHTKQQDAAAPARMIRFLRRVPLLKPLTEQQIVDVAAGMDVVKFADGEVIVAQGQPGDCSQCRCCPSAAPPLPLVAVSIGMHRGCQHFNSVGMS